jgi:pyruvate formate lyase activating enzyme
MRILGFLETSLVDWDGKITSVIFVGGCNFSCPFCHNHELADDRPELKPVDWAEIQVALLNKDKWLDGVVVTGGEPMMHPEVFRLCADIKQLGKPVKLDTNGSFPYQLKRLIEMKLVDFVAMDIKAPLDERYSAAAGRPADVAPLLRTVRLLRETGIDHEFRMTLVPGLVQPADIPAIGRAIEGAPSVALQHYDPTRARVPGFGGRTYSRSEAESMAKELKPFVTSVTLRGKWS